MYSRAGTTLKRQLQRSGPTQTRAGCRAVSTNASRSTLSAQRRVALALATAAGGLTLFYYTFPRQIHNDALPPSSAKSSSSKAKVSQPVLDPNVLHSLVWGSNSSAGLAPDSPATEPIRTPAVAAWLEGIALRDLGLHEKHAACVDARGDVYQWGEGFFGAVQGRAPKRTLRGKNIIQLQLTDDKIFALSSSGRIYVLASSGVKQGLSPGKPTPASDSWWGTGWLWGEDQTVDFAEISPAEPLGWGESITSIAAGKNHLLALSSKGRVLAHPVNNLANFYGQLGLRKFEMPDPAQLIPTKIAPQVQVELIPKSLADPFINSSRAIRVSSTAFTSENLANVDDKDIRFCTKLYEVPVLKEVEAAQIAAGSRTSFLRTSNGRVLAWGANDFGQLGLGSNVALDTITVPTEVVLWRFVSNSTETKCLDVVAGGDLTAFVVERKDSANPATLDVLMSGNGQYGGLGNNSFTNSQGTPTRVKAISGLQQYNEHTKRLEPIKPEEVVISSTGHVVASLNSSPTSDGIGGKDLMVWGKNYESELGNGKKSSLPQPAVMEYPEGERLMLMKKKAKEVKDLQGKVWKRGIKVEQRVAVGPQNSVVYWKLV
ncbi:regulator of chromosome condensation 1/beta-lactamase-inhibitor protein II [Crepidotus variabilis]|uniref:Regulator of chromosome condensation 1/beta-lactamase-inhibitor protein II n=1 Tax=Crepidotus variabilis TaxID=179855 RepID=A0A9P6ER02_9AGAR|nr:regulator of chromosome condensation 1/beta-lactamase-inhibitor protein II [Crepidotus variabilis]